MRPTGDTKPSPRPMRSSDRAGRRGDGCCGQRAGGEDVERARATERRADRCFSARIGRSRWDRPGTPSLPLGRCVVRTGRAAAALCVGLDIAGTRAKERRVDRCFPARMGRSRCDRPGTPSLTLCRCVPVHCLLIFADFPYTEGAARGTTCASLFICFILCASMILNGVSTPLHWPMALFR